MRPSFAPETVTSDHGSVYKNHHLVQVARTLGTVVLPARAMRPQDKAACERAFSGIQSLLLALLLGYRGIDVADRGADPEGDAVWTVDEMEHLLARLDREGVEKPQAGPVRARLGPWRPAQSEHALRGGGRPRRDRPADPGPEPLPPSPARSLREDPRPSRGEDRRTLVRR
ncbi:hypothetical protein ACFO9E_13080 [Streptomyces maoxianensis]|uniref:Integrase catalytic domain-containing protein n=1 Tax=Streptomyces maoxianensis TaxID=1459942 RepID=A0ABV9G757_9ACTN